MDRQWALTCSCSLVIDHGSHVGVMFYDSLLCGSAAAEADGQFEPHAWRRAMWTYSGPHFQVSHRLGPAAGPVRQMLSASTCKILERPLSSSLQVLWYLSCCFWTCGDFGNRSSDQKVRSLSCLCSGAQSLCTLLIWETQGTADVTDQTLWKG